MVIARRALLAGQCGALIAAWTIWRPTDVRLLGVSLVYALALWIAAEAVTIWIYFAFSVAPFPELLASSLPISASAMWCLPGVLLLAGRSPVAVVLGVAAITNSARLLVSNRVPKGGAIATRRRSARDWEPPLFGCQLAQPVDLSRETIPIVMGALALETGVYAIAREYALLAAAAFATAAAIWSVVSVARGAMEPRTETHAPYSTLGILLTLLLTVTLTAVLLRKEIVQEGPSSAVELPGMTSRMLRRLAHVPPRPTAPAVASGVAVAQLVDTAPAFADKERIPGVVLSPRPAPRPRPRLILRGLRSRSSIGQSLAIPFTGVYHLFGTSSKSLPANSIWETGTPLRNLYRTNNGSPMETDAVQPFEPPIDLTRCGKVSVAVTSAETMPVLASMLLAAERTVVDGGSDLLGMKPGRGELLEFQIPFTARRLLVHEIRISFQRLGPDLDKNVRIAVERLTLEQRGR